MNNKFKLSRSNFNPLPPQGGRPQLSCFQEFPLLISIHSLPKEGDPAAEKRLFSEVAISIHSLPKEGDTSYTPMPRTRSYFNPLPPQGGRRRLCIACPQSWQFQSTPSPRRETRLARAVCRSYRHFNPLPPQGGRRWRESAKESESGYFNPLPPQGGRHSWKCRFKRRFYFNPLPPQGGRL